VKNERTFTKQQIREQMQKRDYFVENTSSTVLRQKGRGHPQPKITTSSIATRTLHAASGVLLPPFFEVLHLKNRYMWNWTELRSWDSTNTVPNHFHFWGIVKTPPVVSQSHMASEYMESQSTRNAKEYEFLVPAMLGEVRAGLPKWDGG
jgi:hypothetical protein